MSASGDQRDSAQWGQNWSLGRRGSLVTIMAATTAPSAPELYPLFRVVTVIGNILMVLVNGFEYCYGFSKMKSCSWVISWGGTQAPADFRGLLEPCGDSALLERGRKRQT